MLRSVLAVAAGCVSAILPLILVMMLLGIFVPDLYPRIGSPINVIMVSIVVFIWLAFAGVGALVTVVACHGSRIKHVHALSLVVLFIGLVSLAANIDKQPMWFSFTQVFALIFGVYIGGHLANKRFPQTAPRT